MTAKLEHPDYRRAMRNLAVAHCQKAYDRAYRRKFKESDSKAVAGYHANEAFKAAMPLLVGSRNIRDFIACVAFGMESGAIMEDTATKYLLAAQVALRATSLARNAENANRTKKGSKFRPNPPASSRLHTKTENIDPPVEISRPH
jgi:hypothetical protein